MTTIFLTVQTGMVVRDLLLCGPLEVVLSHPNAQVVLLTPGARDPAFIDEFRQEQTYLSAKDRSHYRGAHGYGTVSGLRSHSSVLMEVSSFPPARKRPLFPYLGKSAVFHCPADKGSLASC